MVVLAWLVIICLVIFVVLPLVGALLNPWWTSYGEDMRTGAQVALFLALLTGTLCALVWAIKVVTGG